MARHVVEKFVDDIDGTTDDVRTVQLGIDGKAYEIDLSEANAAKLRDVLTPFVAAARRPGSSQRRSSAPAVASGRDNVAIRVWLLENGYKVSERGRIKTELLDAYDRREPAGAVQDAAVTTEATRPSPKPRVAEVAFQSA